MKKISLFLIIIFGLLKTNAQIIDSLARCGKAPYFFVVNFPNNLEDNTRVNFTFEQAGSKFTYKDNGVANFNSKLYKFELNNKLNSYNEALSYYKVGLDDITIYVPNDHLQNFVQEFLAAKKSKIHTEIWLDNYFSSISYKRYEIDRKNNVPKYQNGYCFNLLRVIDIKSVTTSLALKNILLEIKNEGTVSSVNNNMIRVLAKKNADFIPDVDYFVAGKPALRVRFKTSSDGKNFEADVNNPSEIKENDIVTNIQ